MKKSNLFRLNVRDLLHGFLMAFIGALVGIVMPLLEAGHFPSTAQEWQNAGYTSLVAAVVYLCKKFLSNSEDKMLKKEDNSKIPLS